MTEDDGISLNNFGAIIVSYIERLERLEEEIRALNQDKSEIYKEAKGNGLHVKIIRRIIQLRRMEEASRLEEDELLHIYMRAVGLASSATD